MKKGKQRLAGAAAAALVVLLGLVAGPAAAQYVIGPDDLLQISFWQDPDLNTQVRVGQDGKITLDVIGQIEAQGKTTEQLQNDIVRQISRLKQNISQAVVRVIAYNYNYVFVIGQITLPGKRSFEEIPDLWTLINESGGTTEFADLRRVTIIRGGAEAGKVEVVNVRQAIATGKPETLPKIRRMDTIEIPRLPVPVSAGAIFTTADRKNLIYVIGAVNSPGPITYEENIDVLDALSLAGGPTDAADLKQARLVIKDGMYAQTIGIDLDKYWRSGRPARYILQKEDTFILPARGAGFLGVGLPAVVGIIGAVASAILVYDRLTSSDGV
ncbi:MAG TPA: polysaccharide biosynthesis/export family protein [Acidobacteriota bacterium]|nr:polysaccharide biosynthesis/export family protein [Acidobacteriota bacterium]